MSKSPWAKLNELWSTPIDWAALAAQVKGPTRKGDKRARWEVEKLVASRRANQRRRQQEATERVAERLAAQRRHKPSGHNLNAIFEALEPGRWMTRVEIRDATGVDYQPLKGALVALRKAGFLQQRERKGWKATVYSKGVPIHLVKGHEARYELALTAKGAARRAWVLAQKESAPEGAFGGGQGGAAGAI